MGVRGNNYRIHAPPVGFFQDDRKQILGVGINDSVSAHLPGKRGSFRPRLADNYTLRTPQEG